MAGMSERAQLQMAMKASALEEEERQRKSAGDNPSHAPAPLPPAGVSTTDKQAWPKLGQASSSDDPSFDVGAMVVVDDPKYVDAKTGRRTAYKIMHFQARSPTDRNIALACPLTALRARLPLPPHGHHPYALSRTPVGQQWEQTQNSGCQKVFGKDGLRAAGRQESNHHL